MNDAIILIKTYDDNIEKELKRTKTLLSNSISYIFDISLEQYTNDDLYKILLDIGMSPDEILNFIEEEG